MFLLVLALNCATVRTDIAVISTPVFLNAGRCQELCARKNFTRKSNMKEAEIKREDEGLYINNPG